MWIIEYQHYDYLSKITEWRPVTGNCFKDQSVEDMRLIQMRPREFEEVMKLALDEHWNPSMFFRFKELETGEVIPFELFPEIQHFNRREIH